MATASSSESLAVADWDHGSESKSDRYLAARLGAAGADFKAMAVATFVLAAAVAALVWLAVGVVAEHWLVPGGLPAAARWAWFGIGTTALAAAIVRWIVPLVRYRVNLVYAARVIEHEHPELHNDIVNAVLAKARPEAEKPHVVRSLERRAAKRLSTVPADGVADRDVPLRLAVALAALVAAFGVYQFVAPKSLVVSAARLVAPWWGLAAPARVSIAPPRLSWRMPPDGTGADRPARPLEPVAGTVTLVRGRQLLVETDIVGLHDDERPVLEVTPLRDDGTADAAAAWQAALVAGGEPGRMEAVLPGADRGLEQALALVVVAGDARSERVRVAVVDTPTLLVREVRYDYPAYTGRAPETVAWQGDLEAPEFTKVTITAEGNRPLEAAWIDPGCGGRDGEKRRMRIGQLDLARASGELLLRLNADRTGPEFASYRLGFQPRSSSSREPPVVEKLEHRIEVIADVAPEVAIDAPDDAVRAPPAAPVAIRVRAVDPDYGLARVGVEMRIRGAAAAPPAWILERTHAGPFAGALEIVPEHIGATAGTVLEYRAVAHDTRPERPNVTYSPWQSLHIDQAAPPLEPPARQPSPRDDPRRDQQADPPRDNGARQEAGDKPEQGGGQGKPESQAGSGAGQQQSQQQQQQPNQQQQQGSGGEGKSQQTGGGGTAEGQQGGKRDAADGKTKTGAGQEGGEGEGRSDAGKSGAGSRDGAGEQADTGRENGAGEKPGAGEQSGAAKPANAGKQTGAGDQARDGEQSGAGEQSDAGKQQAGRDGAQAPPRNAVAADGTNDGEAMDRILENRRREEAGQGERQPQEGTPRDDATAQQSPACQGADGKPCGKEGCSSCKGGGKSGGAGGGGAGQGQSGQAGDGQTGQGQSGQGTTEGQGEGQGAGQDQGQGQGQGAGQGAGQGQGEGQGKGAGEGQGAGQREGQGRPEGQGKPEGQGQGEGEGQGQGQGKEQGEGQGRGEGQGQSEAQGQGQAGNAPSGERGGPTGKPGSDVAGGSRPGAGSEVGAGGRGGGDRSAPEQAGDGAAAPRRDAEWTEQDTAHARNAADLAVAHLRDSVNAGRTDVLDELGWTPEQARAFIDRWEAMRRLEGSTDPRQRGEFERAVRSLGLRPDGVRTARDVPADAKGGQAEGRRSRPPAAYREQVEAYLRGTGGG